MANIDERNAAGKSIMDYIPMAAAKLFGKQDAPLPEVAESDAGADAPEVVDYGVNDKAIAKAIQTLKEYKDGKRNFESRLKEEEKWWKLRHWDVIGHSENRAEPTSAWLFNSISNKHADIMDNYPEPNVLPRERSDERDADVLSSVLPVIFERNQYEKTYSDAAWYKIKHGVSCKGVFWNKELEDGLGDVDVHFIDMLNVFWEPGITDLQASRNLFIVDLKDNDLLEAEYPQLKNKTGGQIIDIEQYAYDDEVDITNKSCVVDWYYKKHNSSGRIVLHYCKFVGNEILYASENEPEYAEEGYYSHGKYPIEFDVLFPDQGTCVGFGYIAIMKSPQTYIDKLSQALLENTILASKPRFFAKKVVGINESEFLDWSKPIVHVEGDISEERLVPITVQQVNGNALNMLQMKIDELKETSSNRDVSSGSTGGGVTAAAAIAALQEAGNKTSRDMISASYRAFTQECYLAIELIRQFYTEQRTFRIVGADGKMGFVSYNNSGLAPQPLPEAYPGQSMEPGFQQAFRKPVFDVAVKPQKRNPYSRMSQNETAKELYNLGFFNPQLAQQSLIALDMMEFEGDDKIRDKVQEGQTLQNLLNQAMQENAMLKSMLGIRMPQQTMPGAAPAPQMVQGSDSIGSRAKDAETANMTAYGEKLAKKAQVNMNNEMSL